MGGASFSSLGGHAIALAIAAAAALRFVRWLIEFVARRQDSRSDRLDVRELNLEQRMNKRLKHVESELGLYREATMLLIQRLANVLPNDPVLGDVARILAKAVPLAPSFDPDPGSERLLAELDKVAGTKGGKNA